MGASLVLPVTRVGSGIRDVVRRAVSLTKFGASISSSSEMKDDLYKWMESDPLLQCLCRFSDNFFVKQLGRHVSFDGTAYGFEAKYADLLVGFSETEKQDIQLELASELSRRKTHFTHARRRKLFIKNNYSPKHGDIYTLQPEHLDTRFRELTETCLEALRENNNSITLELKGSAKAFVKKKCPDILRQRPAGVFSFPVFSLNFCKKLREECQHFEQSGMPISRPNTMNDNGLLLFELGMYENFIDVLLEKYISPVSKVLFGEGDPYSSVGLNAELNGRSNKNNKSSPGATSLDHHRSFLVRYEPGTGRDVDLAYHYDDSEITLNVNLGGTFDGGELLFGGLNYDESAEAHASRNPIFHKPGVGVLHRGSHCHEAVPTESGKRMNLIIWGRSSVARRKRCAMCLKDK